MSLANTAYFANGFAAVDSCKSCWWQEGGRCYVGNFIPDNDGRSVKIADKKCDRYRSKRSALETIIPGHKLFIISENIS